MNPFQKAEALVREKLGSACPEGHLHLEHWLDVLEWSNDSYPIHLDLKGGFLKTTQAKGHPIINRVVIFDLATGQPASETDYRAFNEIMHE